MLGGTFAEPMPRSPERSSPHDQTVWSLFSARLCPFPAVTATTSLAPAPSTCAGVGRWARLRQDSYPSWLLRLLPQAQAAPVVVAAAVPPGSAAKKVPARQRLSHQQKTVRTFEFRTTRSFLAFRTAH